MLKRNLSTPKSREFWAFVDKTARDVVESFPLWKIGGEQNREEIRRERERIAKEKGERRKEKG